MKLGKTRKSRKFREREQGKRERKLPRDLRVVAALFAGRLLNRERRVTAPGIEFNAHCYQRREDATQPHCLAGLVTAGDIINRLRAPHLFSSSLLPSPSPAGLCCERKEASRMAKWARGGGNILYFLSENITVSWLCGIWLSPSIEREGERERELHGKWNSRGVPTIARASGLRCIYQKNEFAQGVDPQFTERK